MQKATANMKQSRRWRGYKTCRPLPPISANARLDGKAPRPKSGYPRWGHFGIFQPGDRVEAYIRKIPAPVMLIWRRQSGLGCLREGMAGWTRLTGSVTRKLRLVDCPLNFGYNSQQILSFPFFFPWYMSSSTRWTKAIISSCRWYCARPMLIVI